MLEHIEQRIEDLTPTNGDLIAASEYVRDCRYLINEYEECRDDALILHKQVDELKKALTIVKINLEHRKSDDMTLWSLWDISQKALERSETK